MTSRESILDSLRRAVGQGVCNTAPADPGAPAHGPDDWALLRERAELRGARYVGVDSLEAAAEALGGLLDEYGVRAAMAWEHPDLEALGLARVLEGRGVRVVPVDAPLDERAATDMGITAAQAVIPEAGAVVVVAGGPTPRQTSLLPPVHVALVLPGRAVPTIPDLPPFVRSLFGTDGLPPSALHLITGPSSTADIEKTVVKGVHGPTVCVILAVEASA